MENRDNYYNQLSLWNKTSEEYQIQVLMDILSLIPEDTERILDVGCGDGYITNSLPQTIDVVGMDISESALKYVKRRKTVGEIINIPFPDKSFDLVICNDVIEHIPDNEYYLALNELKRVAKKYILITVPHNEDINSKEAKCLNCGEVYHINWHQRSYTEKSMKEIICDNVWNIREIRYSGGTTLPMHDPTTQLKHESGYFYFWEDSICPKCGSKKKINKNENTGFYRVINSVRHTRWFSKNIIHINRSEIITLYSIDKQCFDEPYDSQEKHISGNILEIDFSNKLQMVSDFVEGSNWAKFKESKDFNVSKNGISVIKDKSTTEINIKMPTVPNHGDCIEIRISNNSDKAGKIDLYATDGISTITDLIGTANIPEGYNTVEIPITFLWTGDKFGLSISMYLYGNLTIHSVLYKPANKSELIKDFWKIGKGHNVFLLKNNKNYIVSYGFYSNVSGKIPKPDYDNFFKIEHKNIFEDVINQNQISLDLLFSKINKLNNLFEEKEIQREKAENAYANLQLELEANRKELLEKSIEMKKIEKLYKQKELERDNAEKMYTQASKYATYWEKNSSRKAQRVLVISHMFPTISNPIGGSFIHEQVKALRENEGIDARVISCQPFWLNGFNLFKIFRACRVYPNQLKNEKWTEYDGVPVLYLPYKVGMPFIPFHFHSKTYTNAIMNRIEEIWEKFKFDIVHAHTSYLDGRAALNISKKYKVPFVITEHTGPLSVLTGKPIVRQITLRNIRKANKVWAVSDSLAKEIKECYFIKKGLEHIEVLYNGVATSKFKPKNIEEHKRSKENICLMYVGYLEEVKNPINLIQAFDIVHKKYKNTELKIVGDGTLRQAVESEIKTLGIEDNVEILGLQPREKVAELMQSECDIFVLPSKTETFGVVLIEALASGIPVVATKCGGPESIIKESYLGELCENKNPKALATSIVKVINNLDNYDSDLINKYALDNFDFKSLSEKLNKFYQKI